VDYATAARVVPGTEYVHVDPKIESGDADSLEKLSNALKIWIKNQAKTEIEMEDGTKK
jgi:hypothetical protein